MHDWTYNSALGCYEVTAPMACDGDGANGQSTNGIACYAPRGMQSLDDLANAGHAGNWWGVLTDNGRGNGNPLIQDSTQPSPGSFISTTSYEFSKLPDGTPLMIRDVNRYLDAGAVKFIVVPGKFRKSVPGIVLGCYCEVEREGKTVAGIVGDIGPDFGEASIAMCKEFDASATPRGSNIGECTYRIFPGRAVDGVPLLRA